MNVDGAWHLEKNMDKVFYHMTISAINCYTLVPQRAETKEGQFLVQYLLKIGPFNCHSRHRNISFRVKNVKMLIIWHGRGPEYRLQKSDFGFN